MLAVGDICPFLDTDVDVVPYLTVCGESVLFFAGNVLYKFSSLLC